MKRQIRLGVFFVSHIVKSDSWVGNVEVFSIQLSGRCMSCNFSHKEALPDVEIERQDTGGPNGTEYSTSLDFRMQNL